MNGEPYTVVNYVTEIRARGGPWGTWPEAFGDDETEAQEAFLRIRRRRQDPAASHIRPVSRTAVITDEVLAAEREDGTLDVTDAREPS